MKTNASFASGLIGGEITWTYAKAGADSGKFKFQVRVYRDCLGINADTSIVLSSNAPGAGSGIILNQVSINEISPIGSGCPTCATPNISAPVATQEIIYESSSFALIGVPPSSGWYFTYNNCCRNSSILNLDLNSPGTVGGMTLRAVMYPYNAQNTFPAFDNSPYFSDHSIITANTYDHIALSNGAYDDDGDSISFDWASPIDNSFPGNNYNFLNGYNYNNPLPDSAINPMNEAASMSPINGIIRFYCVNPGSYEICIKVTAWRCGQKTAEIFRDMDLQIMDAIISGGANPVRNSAPVCAFIPPIPDTITVEAGDTALFAMSFHDFDLLPNGNQQSISFWGFSNEFGSLYTNPSTGCVIPPCATLDRHLPQLYIGTVGGFNFKWVTSCNHLEINNGCQQHSRKYFYNFKIEDNFCPSPGIHEENVTVSVRGPEIYQSGNDLVVSSHYLSSLSIQWYLNGTAVPGANAPTYTPTQNGIYSVVVTGTGGCQELSNAFQRLASTGIKDEINHWQIVANYDGAENINILVTAAAELQSQITISDTKGATVYTSLITLENGPQHLLIYTGKLSKGVYLITLNNSSTKLTRKIIVD